MDRLRRISLLTRPAILVGALVLLGACERAPDGTLHLVFNGPEQAIIPETAHPLLVDRKGEQISVRLPECGDFSRPTGYNPRNIPHSNWGCAHQRNLGLMVANPAELVGAAAFDRRSPTRTTRVIRDYSAGKATKSEYTLDIEVGGAGQ